MDNTGMVQMWVTDAPRTDNISEIWVTVSDVKIHEAAGQVSDNGSGETMGVTDNGTDTGGWISANLTGPARFDLLTLRGDNGGLQQILATANLTAGQYTQIRMTIGKVEVNVNGVLEDGVLPGRTLKFVHPFDIQAGSVTKLLFDFDADKFVNITGSPKEPQIIVKPVVKLIVSKPAGPATASAVRITTRSLPDGTAGVSYNVTLSATGGTPPYAWSINGTLPHGLALIPASGVIWGIPDETGTSTFTMEVSDNATPANNDSRKLSIQISD